MSDRETAGSQMLHAALRLRELILEGKLAGGARLSEIPLSAELGVSRTPLRLALARLEHEGLVEALPAGGFAVRAFSRRDVEDAIELRGVLEGTAARLAAERGVSARDLEPLHGCVAQLDAVVRPERPSLEDFRRYVELNARFHELLTGLAGSRTIEEAIARAQALPFASPSAFVEVQAELPESHRILHLAQAQHRALLEAIEGREGARAESLAREHAQLARRNLDVALQSQAALEHLPGAGLIVLNGGAGG